MDASAQMLFEQLGIALALGLLVGLQREHSESPIAGFRTFPIVTILGAVAALVDQHSQANGWVIACGLLAVAAVVVTTNLHRFRSDNPDFGMTTEAALLLMFGVGAYVVAGDRIVAVAIGAGSAVLLQFKPELHDISARLGDEDLRAIMTFALITCVILPVLPNTTFDTFSPLDVVNPFETWLMVVLMVGISLGGYLTYKFFGRNAGVLLGGVLGGAISSTATTISYAKRTRSSPDSARLAAVVIVIASTVVYGRVLLEIAVVARPYFWQLAPPVCVMLAATGFAGLIVWFQARDQSEEMPEQKNPTELRSAIVFALLYAGVLMALSVAKTHFSSGGTFAVAILSGLTDMDAITLSTAHMVQLSPQHDGISVDNGWRIIVLASMSNLFFKGLIVAVAGNRRLVWRVAALFAIPMLTGIGLLLFWGDFS